MKKFLKRITVLFLILSLNIGFAGCPKNSGKSGNYDAELIEWIEKYESVLSQYKNLTTENYYIDPSETNANRIGEDINYALISQLTRLGYYEFNIFYAFHDFDNNGVLELIIGAGMDDTMVTPYDVYTYADNKCIKLFERGDCGNYDFTLNDNGIITVWHFNSAKPVIIEFCKISSNKKITIESLIRENKDDNEGEDIDVYYGYKLPGQDDYTEITEKEFNDKLSEYGDINSWKDTFSPKWIQLSQPGSYIPLIMTDTPWDWKEESDPVFIDLANKLNDVVDRKGFQDYIKNILMIELHAVYKSYSVEKYHKIYSMIKLQGVSEFLISKYIDVIDRNINGFRFIDNRKWEYKNNTHFSPYEQIIYICYGQNNTYDLFNAISGASNINGTVYGEYGDMIDDIMMNGWNMEVRYSFYDWDGDGSDFIENDGYNINFMPAMYENIFEKLRLIAGNDTIEQFLKDKNFKKVADKVDEKLGKGTMDLFLKNISHIYDYKLEYEKKYIQENALKEKSIQAGKAVIRIEKIVFNYMKSLIENISTKKDTEEFMNYYRYYKIIYLIYYNKDTKEIWDIIDYIDNILTDKIITYKVLPKISNDPDLSKSIVKALIYGREYGFAYAYGEVFDLEDCCYQYKENDFGAELVIAVHRFANPEIGIGTGYRFILNKKGIYDVSHFDCMEDYDKAVNIGEIKYLFPQ